MVRIFSAVAVALLAIAPIFAAPVMQARTVSSNLSGYLHNIGSHISSDWRSSSSETIIVNSMVESLVLETVSENVVEESDIQEIISEMSSFGIDIDQSDIVNIIQSDMVNVSEEEIVVQMLEQIMSVVSVNSESISSSSGLVSSSFGV
ncbi:hypothetical protein PUNSTDRAFT_142518 [Punctularia strigosozonata HHB-11173 SS5]|uniref:uncharacterized protein n=1 Tax=Punctularia strigosozonata (strain HHB-11173) TaxID=741275 RepID=UPI0004416D9B|nr:uncharacterized protein PUNSTDRAFT_142518 [Punctularia strigosozonata HHB-11173 SS5]EIN10522.1 hypothetical protein PUNSTDRAFT_142518 [Punctularia strigosozonata HHB-11173 SS5]